MSKLLAGGPRHRHTEPDRGPHALSASQVRWNTVARSNCGHLWVRRYTWVAACIPLFDHYPIWRRLRPWHVGALLRWVIGR